MKNLLKLGAVSAAFALGMGSAHALTVLHVANTDSADYAAFIESQYPGSTWVHKASGLTANETVGGNLDRTGTFGGTAGISLKSYMQSFDLIIVGNNVSSGNFVYTTAAAQWASLTKPVLFNAALAARELGNRPGLFSGDNNSTVTFDNPGETVRVSNTALGFDIFNGVSSESDLYDSALQASTETFNTAAGIGGGEVISNITGLVTAVPATVRGIVFWDAGVANGAATANIQAGKRAFFPMRNAVNSSSYLTADGKIVLGNLIAQLLVTPPFIPPSGLTANPAANAINLSWAGSAGAVSYNVKRSTVSTGPYSPISTPGTVTGTTFVDHSVVVGTTYYYVVTAVNISAVETAISNEASATAVAILPPAALTASTGVNKINLSWSASATAVSYNVKRSLVTGGPYTPITTPGSVTGTTYVDTGVTNDITYYYVVTAVNGSSAESIISNQASAVAVNFIQPAAKILYVANANSTNYQAFATSGHFANNTWTYKPSGLTADETVGGDLDRAGIFGGIFSTLKDYLQTFDLIIIGNGVTSTNFVHATAAADWASLTKPVLYNASLAVRELGPRSGMFSGDNNISVTFDDPSETVRVSGSPLADAIFSGVGNVTDLYNSALFAFTESINAAATFGGGEVVSNITGTVGAVPATTVRGIVFWNAGVFNGAATANVQAGNRAFFPMRNENESINYLTADGKVAMGNLIVQLLVAPPFLPPSGLTATLDPGTIILNWAGSAGAVSYNVYRSETSTGPYSPISNPGEVTGTQFYDFNGVTGTTYYYVVTAVNSLAFETGNSNEASATAAAILPPTALIATSGLNQINLFWNASGGAFSYNVLRSNTSGGPYTEISTPDSVIDTTYVDGTVTNNITYYYVVRAVDGNANVSLNSNQASASAVGFIQPAINILYISNANSAEYQSFATSGQFANNTWTQKATGFGNDQIGGDLYRTALFDGNSLYVKDYMETFDLIIIGVPTTSSNFADGALGVNWSEVSKPIVFHANTVARSAGGRPGMFSQDNFITFNHGIPDDSIRASNSSLANAILAGVSSETDLYSLTQSDTIANIALHGTGERITNLTNGVDSHYGIVFWAAGDLNAAGFSMTSNRAFMELKGGFTDLTANGRIVAGNLINQILLPQVTPENPYGAWAATTISLLDPNASPAFDADLDLDGLGNGLEWILGGDPFLSDHDSLISPASGNASGGLTLVFNKPTAGSIGGATLKVDWDSDLDGFANSILIGGTDVGPSGSNPTVDIDAPAPGKVTVNIPSANAASGKLFGRLKGELVSP